MIRRRLYILLRLALLAVTAGALVAALRTAPFVAPFTERTVAATRIALERAMARTVTPEWLLPRLDGALAAGDLARADMLAGLAADHAIPLPPDRIAALEALRAAESGWLNGAVDCGRCALDLTECRSVGQLAACGLPLELTPVGDANALRRAAVAAAAGEDVDRLEVGLALVGLGASALVLMTGGGSGVVKVGASGLRVARRMGTLTPAFARVLADAADLPVAWGRLPAYVAGNAPLEAVTDTARLARLGAIAGDIGVIRRNTSTADTLLLLRHVDSAEDAARLARLSDAAGPATPRVMEVLGKSRAFRAMLRLTDAAMAALALVWALAVQLGTMIAGWMGRAALRALRPPRPPRRVPPLVAKPPPLRHDPRA